LKSNRSVRLAAILLGASLIAAACGSSKGKATTTTAAAGGATTSAASGATTTGGAATTAAAPTTAAAKKGGTITVAVADKFTAYNNGTADGNLLANQEILNGVQAYASYFIDKGGKLTLNKELIDSAELTSKSPQVVTYKINPKAVWSDGKPVDGSDFYLAWVANNGIVKVKDDKGEDTGLFLTAGTTGYEQIKSVESSADGKTVTVTYAKPFADWLNLFTPMMPAHVVAAKSGVDIKKAYEAATAATPVLDDIKKVADFWNTGLNTDKGFIPETMLSAGPYVISEYVADQSVTLTRNDKWWGTPGVADKFIYRIIIEDTAAVQALQNSEVQVISPQSDPDLLNQLKGLSGAKVTSNSGFTFEHFDMNLANPVLADLNVRKAMAYCLPRQDMVDKLMKPLDPNAKIVNNRIFLPLQADYKDNSGAAYDKVDIDKAKASMEAGGWKLNGAVYEKDGKKAEFKLLHKKNARRQAEFELTQASCAKAGISVIDDGDDKWSSRAGKKDFDAVVFAWIGSDLLSPQKSQYVTDGGQNWNAYSNKDVDANLEILASDLDSTKWPAAGQAVDVQMWKDLPTIPIFQFVDLLAYSNKVSGVSYNPTQQGFTWNMPTWSAS